MDGWRMNGWMIIIIVPNSVQPENVCDSEEAIWGDEGPDICKQNRNSPTG